MKKVSVIGLFRTGLEAADGQSIKTRIVTREIEKALGENNVCRIDTYGWKKHPFGLMLKCVYAALTSEDVVFMTDEGGINIFPWLLTLSNVFGRCHIHYVVIGGWLVRSLQTRRLRRFWLKHLHGVYVETNTMKAGLERLGFQNAVLLPNFKELPILQENELTACTEEPFRLCTFSRVMKEKGIEDAVDAVHRINQQYGRTVFTLDIYGQVDGGQIDWFEALKRRFSGAVRYCGTAPYDQSVAILRDYFALLFPTRFYTEGIPGTIIDACAAGVPTIASQWESFHDIMTEEICLSYAFDRPQGLEELLRAVAEAPMLITSRKKACLRHAQKYAPGPVMDILLSRMKYRHHGT